MGGLIIILATLIPVLLFAKLENIYVILLIVTTLWMGTIGFIDDYIKLYKKNKAGMPGKFKVIGQVGLGIFVGATMYFHPGITVRGGATSSNATTEIAASGTSQQFYTNKKAMFTTIPFVKKNEFDYGTLISWAGENYRSYIWLIFIPIVEHRPSLELLSLCLLGFRGILCFRSI